MTQPTGVDRRTKKSNAYVTMIWKAEYCKQTSVPSTTSSEKEFVFRKSISERQMLKVLHLSQQHACKALNCSLSTLKRRFYELKDEFGLEKWPQYFFEIRHLPIFDKVYPMSLNFILNNNNGNNSTCDEDSTSNTEEKQRK